jgi:hypothetical protein
MEVPQGNSLCNSYLKQAKNNIFFYKIKEQEGRQVLPGGVGTSWRGKRRGKGVGG